MAEEVTTPPRASLLGLPPELRLQVYGYVLEGYEISGQKTRDQNLQMHCCTNGNGGMDFKHRFNKDESMTCSCTKPFNGVLSILGICTAIATEVTPMVCANREVLIRVGSPTWPHNYPIDRCASVLPAYARPRVSRMVVAIEADRAPEMLSDSWWQELARRFIGIHHLRLHLDWSFKVACDISAGFLALHALRSFTLEVHQRSACGPGRDLEDFRRRLTAEVEEKLKQQGSLAPCGVVTNEREEGRYAFRVMSTCTMRRERGEELESGPQ